MPIPPQPHKQTNKPKTTTKNKLSRPRLSRIDHLPDAFLRILFALRFSPRKNTELPTNGFLHFIPSPTSINTVVPLPPLCGLQVLHPTRSELRDPHALLSTNRHTLDSPLLEGRMTPIVIQRNGEREPYDESRVLATLERMARYPTALPTDATDTAMDLFDLPSLAKSITSELSSEIRVEQLEEAIAAKPAYSVTKHPDYSMLGGRLAVLALHRTTVDSVVECFRRLRDHTMEETGRPAPLVSEEVWEVVQQHAEELQAMIDYDRDFRFDYFGYKTLERSYLLRKEKRADKGLILERPQQLILRVAIGIHGHDMERVRATYHDMSMGYYTHATPTLFNSGTCNPQMSSCFLVAMKDDSILGIYETLKETALISKSAGGIGFHCHNVRCAGSYISGTNGTSNGLVPMLRVFNNTARYVDQGGGRRKGAFAAYLEPWHGDILDFLQLKRNTGKDDHRARDLFYGLWIPDLFMERVEKKAEWTLFDPATAPGLGDCYGDEFRELYTRYEKENRGVKKVNAQEVWFQIVQSQTETGTPYMLYKDACNLKSNQKNLGTIKCSNLCTEIVEYTAPDETAVCNLASVALPRFIRTLPDGSKEFDHEKLRQIVKRLTVNLNRVIDNNFYPTEEARRSNMRHRPVGLGVQGLADTFILLRLPFDCAEARRLNEDIFETIYYGAVESSMELAVEEGPYETFAGSPASHGLLQFDLWGKTPVSNRWDWNSLKEKVMRHGMRNSLLVAPMPTASTSQILGNNECFEPITSNIYVRRVLSGEFPVVNKHLVKDLIARGLWDHEMRNEIISRDGSVANIDRIPQDLRTLYRTVWELSQKAIIDMAADRGKYIDQSQSLNLFLQNPSPGKITSMHFYAWRSGLKTGMYYLRTKSAVDAIKFTVDPSRMKEIKAEEENQRGITNNNGPTDCLMCGA
eukprot:gene8328-5838_t